jgi:hypothetical protein
VSARRGGRALVGLLVLLTGCGGAAFDVLDASDSAPSSDAADSGAFDALHEALADASPDALGDDHAPEASDPEGSAAGDALPDVDGSPDVVGDDAHDEPSAPCGPSTCAGCCTTDGACAGGASPQACGGHGPAGGGQGCVACPAPEQCGLSDTQGFVCY